MTHEVGPLVRRPGWHSYRDALLQRFANPALQHSVHQIATDSSQKIPQRWVPCVQAALQAGLPVDRLAFAAAAWMRYLRGADERGQTYTMRDPMAAPLQALALAHAHDPQASVQALSTLPAIWGNSLPASEPWLACIGHWLTQITQHGLLSAMEQFNSTAACARSAGTQT
jgi:fructuronate reductase